MLCSFFFERLIEINSIEAASKKKRSLYLLMQRAPFFFYRTLQTSLRAFRVFPPLVPRPRNRVRERVAHTQRLPARATDLQVRRCSTSLHRRFIIESQFAFQTRRQFVRSVRRTIHLLDVKSALN